MSTDARFWVKIGFKFQSLRKISSISTSDSPVLFKSNTGTCHGNNGDPEVDLNDAVKLAVPENHTQNQKLQLFLSTTRVMTI